MLHTDLDVTVPLDDADLGRLLPGARSMELAEVLKDPLPVDPTPLLAAIGNFDRA